MNSLLTVLPENFGRKGIDGTNGNYIIVVDRNLALWIKKSNGRGIICFVSLFAEMQSLWES